MKEKKKQQLKQLLKVPLKKSKPLPRKLMIRKIKRNWKTLQRKLLLN